jgi:hemerythrin-like domain-containing protein
MANAVELIKSDHRKVEQLYQRYQNANGQAQQKQSIVQEICNELELHAKLEEDLFYPAVERTLGDGANLVKEAIKEHNEVKNAISKLQASQFAGPDCDRVFQDMMSGVQHHVQEEEQEMLPKAQQQLGAELEDLGAQIQQRKQELQGAQLHPGRSGKEGMAQ